MRIPAKFEGLKGQPVLVYDVETKRVGDKINPWKDTLRVFACYSFIDETFSILNKPKDIRSMLEKHRFLVGYNTLEFDNVVMCNNGFSEFFSNYGDKIYFRGGQDIDILNILKSRKMAMKISSGNLNSLLMSHRLDEVIKVLGLDDGGYGKMEIDYEIYNKDVWTPEEKKMIREYSYRDIEITKRLYEWFEEYFDSFKHDLREEDIMNKSYLVVPLSVYANKVICNKLNMEEVYDYKAKGVKYPGGYVSFPSDEKVVGDILALDFNSLYPHIIIQCNLMTRKEGGWSGGELFETQESYDDQNHGKIEQLLQTMFNERAEMKKKKDPREYSKKIVLNTFYGISANPKFRNVYRENAGSDCTSLARQWIKYARKIFRDAGYKVVYSDTDSVYVVNHKDNRDELMLLKDKIISHIKSSVPFPSDTFDMGIDDEIYAMFFFKSVSGDKSSYDDDMMDEDDKVNIKKGLMKKNYIYIAKDDKSPDGKKIVVKNLGIVKKSSSRLARKIFWDYLVPRIKSEYNVKFPKYYINNIIQEILKKDLSYASKRFNVLSSNSYKMSSQLQSQIAKEYGPGVHFLIANRKIGVGKSTKYCTVEEFKKKKLSINHIILDGVMRELEYFIQPEKKIDLNMFG